MKLSELASTIRSKNAGVDHITFDVFFRDQAGFERARDCGVFSPETLAPLFGIDAERIVVCTEFEPAHAFKFTIRRLVPSGSPGEHDVFGAQQYSPLFDLEIP